MAVKIRLMRIGTNRQPFYRVVAVDERKKRTGGYLELLGTYNPLTEPKEINLDQGKIDAWLKKGAVPSYGFLRIIGKAPQKAPRKAKKEKKQEPSAVSPQPSADAAEAPVEEISEPQAPEEAATEATAPIETPAEPEETTQIETPEASSASETPEVNEPALVEEAPEEEPKRADS